MPYASEDYLNRRLSVVNDKIDNDQSFLQDGLGAVVRTIDSKLKEFVSVKDFGAIGDGITDDTVALLAADLFALERNLPIYINVVMNITTPVVIMSLIVDTLSKIFVENNNVTVASGQTIRPEWWGADRTNTLDSSLAFKACLSNAMGCKVELSGGYKFLTSIVVDYQDISGLTICGKGSTIINRNALLNNKCFLNFDNIADGSNALTFKGVRGLNLNNFFVSHKNNNNSGGGAAIWVTQLDMFRITSVDIESETGANGLGFKFGNINGIDCCFMGIVESCKVFCKGGYSFGVYPACTSITFLNCYQIGGCFYTKGSFYTTYITCASEGSPNFGYLITESTNTTFIQCAGEANHNGVFCIAKGSSNINIVSPFGSGNNTSNIITDGDLVFLDGTLGSNSNIIITSPTSLNSANNTISNIASFGANGYTEIQNIYSSNLSKGINGNNNWKHGNLVTTGDLEVLDFSVVLVNWDNQGIPTINAKLIKKGKLVTFVIKVTPSTSIGSVSNISNIVLPINEWGGMPVEGIASITCLDTTKIIKPSLVINIDGVIFLPTFGPINDPIIITATIIVN
jgi:hypothetical protein